MKEKIRVYGEQLLVEAEYEKLTVLDGNKKGKFTSIVKVLAVGDGVKGSNLKEGDRVLMRGDPIVALNGELYIHPSQILRWVD